MTINVTITQRTRRRKTALGDLVNQDRWVANYTDPISGKRVQRFFKRRADAIEYRNTLVTDVVTGNYEAKSHEVTIGQLVDEWLADRRRVLRPRTIAGYEIIARNIKGPLFPELDVKQKTAASLSGQIPEGTKILPGLDTRLATELTTKDIRVWHGYVVDAVGAYSANRAKVALKAVLSLGAEDYGFRPPAMPRSLTKTPPRRKKALLKEAEVHQLLDWARANPDKGLYVAFPFLTGVRIGEALGLIWDDIDFDSGVIHIRHTQEKDGSVVEMTKTEAGTREIPMSSTLRQMLLEWKVRCPRLRGELYRVFPGPGQQTKWPKPRKGGGPILYPNYRKRYWEPALKAAGVPYVTPHSARHYFISTLQAKGFEVGLVAELAGHADANVTLSHYTHAVRNGAEAMEALSH